MPHTFIELLMLTQVPAGPAVPTWGWITICSALAAAVVTLSSLYKGARDREVAAEQSKVALAQSIGDRTSALLERAIEAFTLNKTGNEQLSAKLTELADELRELKQEVRRVGEKVS